MLDYANIIGNQEHWAPIITNVEDEEGQTPFLDSLIEDDVIENIEASYQCEKYDEPEENSHIDGKTITGFKAAGDGRGRLKAVIQYFTKAVAIKRLHHTVTNIAGMPGGELGRDLIKRMVELRRDIEGAFLSDAESRDDTGVVGYKTRGAFKWVQATAQTDRPVPTAFLTPAAQVSTVATGSLKETDVLAILQSIGETTKSSAPKIALPGSSFRMLFDNLALGAPNIPLSGGTPVSTQIQYTKNGNVINRTFRRYESPFGAIDVPGVSWHNLKLSSASALTRAFSCLIIHQKNWRLTWGPGVPETPMKNGKPTWFKKAYEGGATEAFCETIAMLKCLNPSSEAKYVPTA